VTQTDIIKGDKTEKKLVDNVGNSVTAVEQDVGLYGVRDNLGSGGKG